MKKIISILLTLLLIISVMPTELFTITASAATSGYYTYSVSNNEATITDVDKSISGDVTIPSTLGGYTVTSIGYDAFYKCTSLTSVTIPNSVTYIGPEAFKDCTSLASITIPDGITSIGEYAFYNTAYYKNTSNWNNNVLYIGNHLIEAKDSISGSYSIKSGTKTIADSAFYNCTSLTSITIPDSVTSIGYDAFYSCDSLTNATIGNSVTSIGVRAFQDCASLTSITIPDGTTGIGEYAFYNTAYYKNTSNWNNNVLYIGNHLIEAKDSISGSYSIKSGTKTIADSAFEGCTSLTSITIPDSVTSISCAFYNCTSLISIDVDDGNNYFSSENGILFNKTKTEIIRYPEGKISTSYTIPNSVTSIGGGAFSGCSSLTSITIPNSVTSIGDSAFYSCDGLTSITIPEGVTSIGDSAFSDCDGFTSITIPNSVTSIGDRAFYNCSGLTSITIGDSVTSIGNYAFYNCKSLTSITIPNSVTRIGWDAFYSCDRLWHVLYTGTNEQWQAITIGSDNEKLTSAIRHCNFDSSNLTVTDEKKPTCTESGNITFNCAVCESSRTTYINSLGHNTKHIRSIETCTLGTVDESFCYRCEKNVYSQKDNLINGHSYENGVCSKCGVQKGLKYSLTDSGIKITGCDTTLTEVIIPNDISGIPVTSIGDDAFSGCSSLTSVTIPNSVISIGDFAFSSCSSLTSITIPDSVTNIGSHAFFVCSSLTSITIGDGVTSIGYYAFYGCSSLTSITIGDGVTSIADCAFGNCSKLTSVTIGDSVTSIGYKVFYDCTSLTSITIPNSVTSIGDSAFSGCSSLTSITIGGSVTSIGYRAFSDCSSLTSITIPNSVTSIGDSAFSGCDGLTSITIPNSVTSIGDSAFWGCSSLTSITIPNSVTSIGYYAFGYCDSLTSITIPNSVTSIGDSAFYICDSLTSITIPNSVTSIGKYAFSGCDGLTSITIPNSVTSIGDYAFSDCTSLESVTIPNSVTSIGSETFYNCSSITSITIPNSVTSIGDDAFEDCWSLRDVWYTGSISEKESITIMDDNHLVYATWHYNTCEEIHTYTSDCDINCNNCEWVREIKTNHTYSNNCDTTCNVCGVTREITHKYDSGKVTKAATCKATGVKTYTCTVCKATKTETIKKTTTHKYTTTITKATLSKNGSIVKKCSVCGTVASTTAIKYVKSFALTTTSYTYNGSVRTPGVIVKDSAGKALKKDKDYTVSYASGRTKVGTYKVTVTMKGNYTGTKTLYFKINPASYSKCKFALTTTNYAYNGGVKTPGVTVKYGSLTLKKNVDYTVAYSSGRKNVGTYKVTIKMKGNYTGSKTLTFKINPKAASVNKLTAGSKKLTVKLNRSLQQSTGYQIQYSTSKTFKNAKTKTVSSYKTSSTTLTGLKAKTTYYVRVRTYKTVGKTKYYSNWSSYKYMKTK